MDCQHLEDQLNDWLDGNLSAQTAATLAEHVRRCSHCSLTLADERALRVSLRKLPVPGPRVGFANEALRLARLANRSVARRSRRRDLLLAGGGALAAALCVSLVMGLRPPGVRDDYRQDVANVVAGPAEVLALTEGRVQSLRLRIESPREFEGVRFSVELPEHVALVGQPGVRAMAWEGRLAKGENVLELPLLAEAGATGQVATQVSWGSFERRIETRLVSLPAIVDDPRRAVTRGT